MELLTDKTPMLVYPSRQCYFLTNFRTRGLRELDLREIGLYRKDSSASRCRADVDEKEFTSIEFANLEIVSDTTEVDRIGYHTPWSVSYPLS